MKTNNFLNNLATKEWFNFIAFQGVALIISFVAGFIAAAQFTLVNNFKYVFDDICNVFTINSSFSYGLIFFISWIIYSGFKILKKSCFFNKITLTVIFVSFYIAHSIYQYIELQHPLYGSILTFRFILGLIFSTFFCLLFSFIPFARYIRKKSTINCNSSSKILNLIKAFSSIIIILSYIFATLIIGFVLFYLFFIL